MDDIPQEPVPKAAQKDGITVKIPDSVHGLYSDYVITASNGHTVLLTFCQTEPFVNGEKKAISRIHLSLKDAENLANNILKNVDSVKKQQK